MKKIPKISDNKMAHFLEIPDEFFERKYNIKDLPSFRALGRQAALQKQSRGFRKAQASPVSSGLFARQAAFAKLPARKRAKTKRELILVLLCVLKS